MGTSSRSRGCQGTITLAWFEASFSPVRGRRSKGAAIDQSDAEGRACTACPTGKLRWGKHYLHVLYAILPARKSNYGPLSHHGIFLWSSLHCAYFIGYTRVFW